MPTARRKLLTQADITPHRSLLPKMGASGYSFPEAVAELVDNSLEWRVRSVGAVVEIEVTDDRVVVRDNGRGMTPERLASAMKLAYRDETSEAHTVLSQFGLGMKTAAASLGRRFRVGTTTKGATSRFEVEFDADKWARGRGFEWSLPVYEVPGASSEDEHGTTVTITKLHYKPAGRTTELRRDFSQRYASFLQNGDARIRVNTRWLEPERPDVDESTVREFDLEFGRQRVHGWFGLLSEGSQKGYYGWETKRRGRTITMHDKRFGLREHPEFMKIVGVIHLDFLSVSHNKTRWIEDDDFERLQEVLADELRPRVRELVGDEKRSRLNARTALAVRKWVGAMAKAAEDAVPDGAESARKGGASRTLARLGRRYPAPSASHPVPEARSPREAAPRQPSASVPVRGVRLVVDHAFHPMGEDGPWMEWGVRDDGALEVFTNEEFPAFHVAEDKAFYAAVHVAEAIGKLYAREGVAGADADAVREDVLRRAASAFAADAAS